MPKQLEYENKYNEFIDTLKNEKYIVLATINGNKAAARTVFYIFFENSIYFVTSKAYPKCKQIMKNQNVALCLFNFQIEGIANNKGHPSLDENKNILDYISKNRPDMNRYTKTKNIVLIEIKMTKAQIWNNGGREFIDFENKTAHRL